MGEKRIGDGKEALRMNASGLGRWFMRLGNDFAACARMQPDDCEYCVAWN